MLKQGFQENIENIFSQIKEQSKGKPKTQNLLFSATFPEWVDTLSAKYQSPDTEKVDLVTKEAEMPSTITHYLMSVRSPRDIASMIEKLVNKFTSRNGKTIIFC